MRREDCRGDLMRARHRVSKLLLRQGIVYCGGQAWTGAHEAWRRRQRFEAPALQMTFESDYDAVLTVKSRATDSTPRSRPWLRTASSPQWCIDWGVFAGSAR